MTSEFKQIWVDKLKELQASINTHSVFTPKEYWSSEYYFRQQRKLVSFLKSHGLQVDFMEKINEAV